MTAINKWFLSLEPGRQAALRDDKWALAGAAYEAGVASVNSSPTAAPAEQPQRVPFKAIAYGAKFKHVDKGIVIPGVWVRCGPNLIATWDGNLAASVSRNRQSLCSFCSNPDDGSLDELVELLG